MAEVTFNIPKKAFDSLAVRSGEQLPDEVRKAVARGWTVIPQEEQTDGRKKPLVRWKQFQSERPSIKLVEQWHREWPDCLWAVVCGKELVVFDFDGPQGMESLSRSRLKPYVRSPGRGGGAHVYVHAPERALRSRQKTGIPGVELKAKGNLVTFYGERSAGRYETVSRARIYKPADLPKEYRALLDEAPTTTTPPLAGGGAEHWTPERCAAWAMRKLYEDVPDGQLHNGRAAVAFLLAEQLRDVPKNVGEAAMKLFHAQAGDLNSEGKPDPYPLSEALETLKHARSNVPRDWTPGPFAYGPPGDEPADELEREIQQLFEKSDTHHDHLAFALDDEGIRNLPPLEALVPGWVPAVGLTVVWAEPGIGKTYWAVSLAKAVRRGKRWQGRQTGRHGGVLYYIGETVKQLDDRMEAFDVRWPLLRGDEATQRTVHTVNPDLTQVKDVAAVVRTAEAFRQQLGDEGYHLAAVFFDPLADFFTGEEIGEGMIRATRALAYLAEKLQCAVIVLHHSNAAGERARGNDILRQKALVMCQMEKPEANLLAVVQRKNRFGVELAMTLSMTEVDLPDRPDATDRKALVLEWEQGGREDFLACDYDRSKEDRKAAAANRRNVGKDTVGRERGREAVVAAFEARRDAGEPLEFPSENNLVNAARATTEGLSERHARDAVHAMTGRELRAEGYKPTKYIWVGD